VTSFRVLFIIRERFNKPQPLLIIYLQLLQIQVAI